MCRRTLPLVFAVVLFGLPLRALGDQPVQPLPKGQRDTCPYGYNPSGAYCAPMSNAKPALPRVGSCPYGYTQSGSYCLAFDRKAREAVPKVGSCPYGYNSSGAYCLKSSVR